MWLRLAYDLQPRQVNPFKCLTWQKFYVMNLVIFTLNPEELDNLAGNTFVSL